MTNNRREFLLKVAATVCVGLLALNYMVFTPAAEHWKEQSDRITDLRDKIQRGQQLNDRKASIQGRWAEMLRTNLPADDSATEIEAEKAVGRWARDSHISLSSLTHQWQNHDDGCDTLECRVTGEGDQASLGRFIYEMGIDPLPVNVEECELAVRGARGAQLTLTARFTFLRLATQTRRTAR